ncbi:MAG: hypothetical protein PHS86_00665 [Syntrophaceae bacterium]|nr:hypothetical protein [Syntrophaceae bacterium]
MLWKLIGMIILGLVSAGLSYYKKNYFVNLFNDILGKDEDDDAATRVGRGFIYGFLFPVYLMLLLAGLGVLISFLIGAGIVAGIVFVLVWGTEKLLPQKWLGGFIIPLFNKIGMKGAKSEPMPSCTVQSDIYPPQQQ